MAILLLCTDRFINQYVAEFQQQMPNVAFYNLDNLPDPNLIDVAAIWGNFEVDFAKFPNLKVIISLAAGVDHLIHNKTIPTHVPIARIVDEDMRQPMTEYIIFALLNYRRNFITYWQQQPHQEWQKAPEIDLDQCTVGIMGLGNLGYDVAKKIQFLGYKVIGWNKSGECHDKTIHVMPNLDMFLVRSNVVVCLLPLTDDTKHILNYATLMKLPRGAYIINVARGNHLVEKDLLAAIDCGHIAGAFLDVFVEEPLPIDHPFWHHPQIIVTPHISSNAVFKNAVQQVAINYFAAINHKPLINVINKACGY